MLAKLRFRSRPGVAAVRRLRIAAATVIAVLAFALLGAAAGPGWDPEPLTTTIVPEVVDPAVLGSTPETVLGQYETVSRIVEIELADGVTSKVYIVEPVGLTEPAPAVVFLHGAGTGLGEAFAEHATAFASAGVVAVSPSKRLDTYSTVHRDYVAMADDYALSVDLARSLPAVDPDRVGLYAESEGTWVASVLAAGDPALDFVALISAPVVTPREQSAFAVDAYLRNVGVPRPLLRAIPRATGAHLPSGIFAYADFDAMPYVRQLTQPIFMAYGTSDASMPTVQGPQLVMGAVPGGPGQVMLRYYEGANHGIRVSTVSDPVEPTFLAGLAAWMLDPEEAMAQGPAIAGATPVQVHLASAVPQPRWYADGEMLLRVPGISALVLAVGYLALLAAWLVRAAVQARARRRRLATGITSPRAAPGVVVPRFVRPVVRFGLAALAVLIVLAAYVAMVAELAVTYSSNGVAVWGGWVLLQVLAVLAALAGVMAVRRMGQVTTAWRSARAAAELAGEPLSLWPRNGGQAVSALRILGGWLAVLGATGLLVVAAYWGAFSPLS